MQDALKIRSAQMKALQRSLLREQLTLWLQQVCAEQVGRLDSGELDRRLAHALHTAAEHGYRDPDDMAASFVTLMFLLGPGFHRHPAMRRVLDDADTPPRERIASLPGRVSAWSWAAATDCSDDAWRAALGRSAA